MKDVLVALQKLAALVGLGLLVASFIVKDARRCKLLRAISIVAVGVAAIIGLAMWISNS